MGAPDLVKVRVRNVSPPRAYNSPYVRTTLEHDARRFRISSSLDRLHPRLPRPHDGLEGQRGWAVNLTVITFLVLYYVVVLGIGIWAMRRGGSEDLEGFLLGGRNVGPLVTALCSLIQPHSRY